MHNSDQLWGPRGKHRCLALSTNMETPLKKYFIVAMKICINKLFINNLLFIYVINKTT